MPPEGPALDGASTTAEGLVEVSELARGASPAPAAGQGNVALEELLLALWSEGFNPLGTRTYVRAA